MHERGLFQGLMREIDTVARGEGAVSVSAITVRLSPALRLTPEHFREHFEWEARGTVAEGAEVQVEPWREGEPDGDAILLESVELAVTA